MIDDIDDIEKCIEYECPQCKYAGMVRIPDHLLPSTKVDNYADAQAALAHPFASISPEESSSIQAKAMLAIVDAIRELTFVIEYR